MTTYKDWQTGDVINIAASIDEFCGVSNQFIFVKDINVTKSPDACSVSYGEERGCGLHLDNVTLVFKLVKCSGSDEKTSCNPQIVYKTIQTIENIKTNINGVACIAYQVTDQDRLNYESQIIDDSYNVMVCITNSDGQATTPGTLSQVTEPITIIENLCYGLPPCRDKCYGSDLWSMKCEPSTGACIQDVNKGSSLICTATHYIEYDFSFLPQSFLDLVSSNIVDLSNFLGTHLPIPSNIQWMGASYSGGKFGIYVKYTPPSQSSAVIGLDQIQIQSLISLPDMALSTFVGMIAGLVVFAVAQRLTTILGPLYSTIIGIALGLVAWVSLGYTIYEFLTGTSIPGTEPATKPEDKLKAVEGYIDNYVTPFCDQSYPGCAANPPTCDNATMRAYLACTQVVSKCRYAAAMKGESLTECDPINQNYINRDAGLANGTITPAEAKAGAEADKNTVNNYYTNVINSVTCGSGQTYDHNTQKCVAGAEDCWIPGPAGGCILTAKTGKTIAIIGGVVIGGILIFSLIKK